MSFLRYRGDGLYDYPKNPDVETLQARYVFLGPSVVQVVPGKGMVVEEDQAAKERFFFIKKYHFL